MATNAVTLDFSKAQPIASDAPASSPSQGAGVQLDFSKAQPINPPAAPDTSGQVTNDIGKTVIVPKPGEDFSDTMNRGAAQGKKTTQQDISDEMATAPKKVAETLAAAPAAGFAGAAAITGADAGLYQAGYVLGYATEAMKDALQTPLGKELLKMAVKGGLHAAGFATGYRVLKTLGLF